jgi:hypothetical protein
LKSNRKDQNKGNEKTTRIVSEESNFINQSIQKIGRLQIEFRWGREKSAALLL